MSDYVKHGDQSYKWAFEDVTAPEIPGMRITELNGDAEPEFTAEAQNSEGLTATFVKTETAKDKKTFTASGFILDAGDFDSNASNFEFNGRFYIITKKGAKYNHRDFQKCDISGVSYALITS